MIVATILTLFGIAVFVLLVSVRALIHICAPNEVLIFSGGRRRVQNKHYGFRIIKGGMGFRTPMLERVDRLDLTNMIIDVTATNAYSKGGIPLTVHGVANVKVAGHEPVLNNAIERFLGKTKNEIMQVAKATLEGSLRGICATLTPEQINDDKLLFAEKLVHEVDEDMTKLGLVIDTFKIQNVQDDVKYLDSLGRKKNAEVVKEARMVEARAKADAAVNAAENREREVRAQVDAQTSMVNADAEKRLRDALTRRAAVVAEEQSTVASALAQAKAEIGVQKARIEQTRRRLDADVIQPAKADCEAAEANAKATVAPIIADGKARADALRTLATQWRESGPFARDVFMLQKFDRIVKSITDIVATTTIKELTFINGGGDGPTKALVANEQLKQVLGVDIIEAVKNFTSRKDGEAPKPRRQAVVETHASPPPLSED